MKRLTAVSAGLLLSLMAACGGSADTPGEASRTTSGATASEDKAETAEVAASQTFTAADSGKEARLGTGDEVVVSLETCPGCGYQWRITEEPDILVVASVGMNDEPRPTSTQPGDDPIVGAPADSVFRFRGVAPGTTKVAVGYFPPAEDSAEETFTLSFVVE